MSLYIGNATIHMYIYIYMYTYTYTYTYIYIYVHKYSYIIYTHICVYIYMYISLEPSLFLYPALTLSMLFPLGVPPRALPTMLHQGLQRRARLRAHHDRPRDGNGRRGRRGTRAPVALKKKRCGWGESCTSYHHISSKFNWTMNSY